MTGPINNKPVHAPIPTDFAGVKKNLASYDTDHDGTITREEFVKARADEMVASENDADQTAAHVVDSIANAIPLVNIIPQVAGMVENLDFFSKAGFSGSFDAGKDDGRYRDFDVNHDGKIDAAEFHAGKFRERVAGDEFSALDENRDNVLVSDNDAREAQRADIAAAAAKALKETADAASKPDAKPADLLAAGAAKVLQDIIAHDAATASATEKTGASGYVSVGDKVPDQYLLRKFPDMAETAVKEFVAKHQALPTLAQMVDLTKRFADAGIDKASIENVKNSL